MLLRMNGAPISSAFHAIDAAHTTPHTGVDIQIPEGSQLHAIASGVVDRLTDYGSQSIGKGVILRLDDGRTAIYGHMKGFAVKVGQHVDAGQTIGVSGNTGASTGPHLHLGLLQNGKYVDPTKYADAAIAKAHKPGIAESLGNISDGLHALGEFFKQLGHWLNPNTWVTELHYLFHSGLLDTPLIVATIAGILLWIGGAKWHKKYLFWGWVVFWILRAGVFR